MLFVNEGGKDFVVRAFRLLKSLRTELGGAFNATFSNPW
jgi:hypothetical protein